MNNRIGDMEIRGITGGRSVTEFCPKCGETYSFYSDGFSDVIPTIRSYHWEGKCIKNKDIPFYVKIIFILTVIIIGLICLGRFLKKRNKD